MHPARRVFLPSRKVSEINPKLYTVSPNQICVYVRNQPFTISISALQKSGSPILQQLAGGRPYSHPIVEGENGQISIDRDPDAFNFIVQVLTNPRYLDIEAMKKSKCGVEGVLSEARFLELRKLEFRLKEHVTAPALPTPAEPKLTQMLVIRGSTPARDFTKLICSHCVTNYPLSWARNVEKCVICRESQMKIQYAEPLPEQTVESFGFDIAKSLKPVTAADQTILFGECMENLSKILDDDTRVALVKEVREAFKAGNVLVQSAFFSTSREFMAIFLGPPPAAALSTK